MNEFKKMWRHDRWVLPFLREQKGGVIGSVLLSFGTIFAAAALMFVSGFLISRAAQRPSNILLIYVPIVLTRGFGIARPVFRYVERLVSHNWVLRIVSLARQRLYQSAASTASSIRSRLQTGQVLSLLADDLDQLQNLYLRTLFPIGAGIMLYLGSSIGIGVLNWHFMLVWILVLAFILILVPIFSFKMNRAKVQDQKELQSQLYTEATDAILGMQDWVLSGRQADLVKEQGRVMTALAGVKYKAMRFGWWRDFTIQGATVILMVLVLIWSDQQFKTDFIAINYIAAFTLAIIPLVDTFLSVNQGVGEASFYEDSITRLNDLPPVKPAESAIKLPTDSTIHFDQVSFAYPGDDKTVIKDLSFAVQPGEKLALLGRSGAGKTTILKLLAGDVVPSSGQVTIGDVAPSDLNDQLSEVVSVLDQHTYLFDTTILNNIRMGNVKATDEQVKTAVKQAGLADLIESLPDGYQTMMLEAGQRFSGGERQRVALARVLLQDAPIVVLDEPTVSLDPKTEYEVLNQMFSALADRTIVWVTHHLTGINRVDQIAFLKGGHFELTGTPTELYQDSPYFRELLALDQF
ncbi:thiol reductant ABC exporter subunit CydC [Lactobacillaceae bacterium L1_55_11]|nr:thiol reductant ABC exporter subunit CydC [Lactobacillaceae bacterium L1_55_11]